MALDWLGPALIGYRHREEIKHIFSRGLGFLFGSKTAIAFTGMQGVGKSVLLDHLTGKAFGPNYRPPMQSEGLEKGKIKGSGKRLLVSVVPGQRGAQHRLESLDKIFRGAAAVQGVVHVVANGFATTRTHGAIRSLIHDFRINTIAKYKKHQMQRELEDLEETCRAIRDSHRQRHQPNWLVVAIDKVDLYQDKVLEARDYYSPEGSSEFSDKLRDLRSQVGSDYFRWHAVPVCGCLEPFVWHRKSVDPQIPVVARNGYLAQFMDEVKNFCR
jgi:hypothetical protein